ncbi:MAG: helix-turn-helix transcriptional regulator, partial [Desulfobacteraceae bacterium]|nr:helix-turn-helix transcriptional regulator [Desulfobacteraceae bacterium]
YMAHIGKDISIKRRQALLTQKELAEEVGVNINTIRNVENEKNVKIDTLIKICDYLDYVLKFKMVKK